MLCELHHTCDRSSTLMVSNVKTLRFNPQMESEMVNITSRAKSSTDLWDRSWAAANDSDLIAIGLFCVAVLLASIYFSIRFPMSDQVAVLLAQAP